MNTIVNRTNNVNFTTVKTAEEGANVVSRFASLVNLSKFALASKPERQDAIQRIKYALNNYQATDSQRAVLEKVIELLEIE
jgi:hypothetical protein